MESWKICELRKMNKVPNTETEIPKDCAKVKVIRAGISSTDIALYNGKLGSYPMTPCRIAAALISESTDPTLKKGQRVLLSPYSRKTNKTEIHGLEVDGYLADYANVPLCDIYTMPEGITDESITFIDDIAMALKMHEKLNIKKTAYVLIFGASAINIIFAQLCIYYQTIPIIIDNDPDRLDLAAELGVYYQIDTSQESVAEKLKDITSGKLADYGVIDTDLAIDNQDILNFIKNEGYVGLYGFNTSIENLKIDYSPIVNKNLTVYGINNGIGEIETAINMLATEIVKIEGLTESMIDISEAPDKFYELCDKQNYFKTIIKC